MNLGLKNRVAAVSGASKGLGFAVAKLLAAEGCDVGICARGEADLLKAAKTIENANQAKVLAVPTDVSSPQGARDFIEKVNQHFGRLDIVVTSVGGPPSTLFADTTPEQWEAAVKGITISVVNMFQAALPFVQKSDQGRLIAITSIAAKEPLPNLVLSNATRAAIHGVVKTLSKELASSGVTVNAVCPSTINTDRQAELAKQTANRQKLSVEEVMQRRQDSVPLKRFGEPEEFAAAVVFLCSRQASYITGISLPVDGGASSSLF